MCVFALVSCVCVSVSAFKYWVGMCMCTFVNVWVGA